VRQTSGAAATSSIVKIVFYLAESRSRFQTIGSSRSRPRLVSRLSLISNFGRNAAVIKECLSFCVFVSCAINADMLGPSCAESMLTVVDGCNARCSVNAFRAMASDAFGGKGQTGSNDFANALSLGAF
jgi:hypothetical protein